MQSIKETDELQHHIMEIFINQIAERLFLKSYDVEPNKAVLIELSYCFQNLRGKESRLKQLYVETKEALE